MHVPRLRTRPRRLARGAVQAAMILLAAGGVAQARGRDVPVPEWRQGAVRYLLTRPEDKLYKSLKTEQDRRAFIRQFWRRRDPTPETPDNEFRDQFWRRVAAANDLFDDTPRDGWITDRGKIYILLGPPHDTLSEEVAKSHRGIILWTYRSTWAKEIGPNFVVAFAKDVTGEFRISTAPSVDADVFRGLDPNTPLHLLGPGAAAAAQVGSLTGIGRTDPYLSAQGMPSGLTELSLLADLGRLQQTGRLVLNEYVTSQALFGEGLSVIAAVDYYKANNETTYSAITVFIKSKSLQYEDVAGLQIPRVSVYARLEDPLTGELLYGFEREKDFVPSPDNRRAGVNDYLAFQAGAGILPRQYRVVVTVHDRVAAKVGTYRLELDVPDFRGRDLALSSITLAERMERLPGIQASDLKKPYVLGSLRVLPKPGVAYAKEQEFAFYFQVYSAKADAQTGKPLLDVRYEFLRSEENEYQPVGSPLDLPGQTQAAQGFAFSLESWEIGQYRLRVRVTDRLTGANAQREVDFLIR